MKNRLSKFGNSLFWTAGLLAACGMTYSCTDDYELDEKRPSWLGASIYNWLQQPTDNGSYNYYVRLIEELDYDEVLGRTGSKTLFVADDAAFEEFFKSKDPSVNPWGVTSFDSLTSAQKKILLFGSMLDNAYLLEMLSSSPGTNGGEPLEGMALRNATTLTVQDSVTLMTQTLKDSYLIPKNNKHWARFRNMNESELSKYALVMDETAPAMTHFIKEQLEQKNITASDVAWITGVKDATINDRFVFDRKIIDGDITCENGYIHKMNGVLVTPPNMANVIANYNGKNDKGEELSIAMFNSILDRFSAPVYSSSVTTEYKRLNEGTTVDSVFTKRYLSQHAYNYEMPQDAKNIPFPDGSGLVWGTSSEALKFDPGWNAYYSPSTDMAADMAAIYVPTDDALNAFFFNEEGGGRPLMKQYNDNVDSIRLDIIAELVNNHMQTSFNASVPSKFASVMDAMGDPIGANEGDIKDVIMANNGVVYIVDMVYLPVAYKSVSTPALFSDNMRIVDYAIRNIYGFEAYLQSQDSRYSFIIPTDEVLSYIDPASVDPVGGYAQEYQFTWDEQTGSPAVRLFQYDLNTNQRMTEISSRVTTANIENRLSDMLNTHIIVHDTADHRYLRPGEFYKTRGGNMVYVDGESDRLTFQGGYQLTTNTKVESTGKPYDYTDPKIDGNGKSYIATSVIQPSLKSVYQVLSSEPAFKAFLDLMVIPEDLASEEGGLTAEEAVFKGAIDPYFVITETSTDNDSAMNKATEWAKYLIFEAGTNIIDQNVTIFNNYNYTIYVPTEAAIQQAIANGLPTWYDIAREMDMTKRGQMIAKLNRFVRYHFQDNAIAVGPNSDAMNSSYETGTVDPETGRFYSLEVSKGPDMLKVKGKSNQNYCNVTDLRNIMARDMVLSGSAASRTISASSAAVIHQIDGYLDNGELKTK